MTTDQRIATSVRLEPELMRRIKIISQVLGVSMNKLVESALRESVMLYEDDPEFKKKHKDWIASQRL